MRKLFAVMLSWMLVACAGTVPPAPSATAAVTPSQTAAPLPTSSPIPPTETPESQPTSEWTGIPIMPGAIAGAGDEESYVYTIHASLEQVQEYYRLELQGRGWQAISQEEDGLSATLVFMNDASGMLTVSILSKREESLVLLVR